MSTLTESTIKETVLEWLKDLGYAIFFGCDITPRGTVTSLRHSLLPKLMRGEVRVKEVESVL
jgi:hypothetical protein